MKLKIRKIIEEKFMAAQLTFFNNPVLKEKFEQLDGLRTHIKSVDAVQEMLNLKLESSDNAIKTMEQFAEKAGA